MADDATTLRTDVLISFISAFLIITLYSQLNILHSLPIENDFFISTGRKRMDVFFIGDAK